MPLQVLGISGSLRKDSLNTKLLAAACELAPPELALTTASLADLPIYNADLMVGDTFPGAVANLRDAVGRADALLFVSPEYNYSLPGALKNAIDWISRGPNPPAAGKACAIMGASPGMLGTARMQYHLRQVCVFLDLHVLNKPEVMVGKAADKFDAAGRLVDEVTRKQVAAQLAALAVFAAKFRQLPA